MASDQANRDAGVKAEYGPDQCTDWLDIDTMGAQVLERCQLKPGHFGDHENKTAEYGKGYTWHNEASGAYDPFRDVLEFVNATQE